MNTATTDAGTDPGRDALPTGGPSVAPGSVEVWRDEGVVRLVALVTGLAALFWVVRALGVGGTLSWLAAVVLLVIAGVNLALALDTRAPLMVIDEFGVRVRRGRGWRGVPWPEVVRVEHLERTGTFRDGRLTVVRTGAGDSGEAGQESFGVRLSLTTRLVGANWHELTDALHDLTAGRTAVETAPSVADPPPADTLPDAVPDTVPDTALDTVPDATVIRWVAQAVCVPAPQPVDAGPVEPSREPTAARRSEQVVARTFPDVESAPHGAVPDAEPTETIDISSLPVREAETVVARVAVVGSELAQARVRVGLSVEQVAERTRIRPHVIEAIERDDFAPCGGDFYARGHLRTLARVLGVDATGLLATYDERYADAPIDPRRVFEAELATGAHGTVRGGRTGLNWSVLVAAVMAVILVWSVARIVLDHPDPVSNRVVLNGSPSGSGGGGRASLSSATRTQVPVVLTAATGGTHVTVRDGGGKVVFSDQLAFQQTAQLKASYPVRISTTDGGLVVTVAGKDQGPVGATGQPAEHTYIG